VPYGIIGAWKACCCVLQTAAINSQIKCGRVTGFEPATLHPERKECRFKSWKCRLHVTRSLLSSIRRRRQRLAGHEPTMS